MPPAPPGQDGPHTIMREPVHTADWSPIAGGAAVVSVAAQVAGRVGVAEVVGDSDPEPQAHCASASATAAARAIAARRQRVVSGRCLR